jgi:hypothetical protein
MIFDLPVTEVQRIRLQTDYDVTEGSQVGEYNSFRIEVQTAAGTWIIEGCHDMEPSVFDPHGNCVA